MRCSEQNKKTGGPLGIRAGIWLVVFGLLLACMLTIWLPRHYTNSTMREISSEDQRTKSSFARPQAGVRRTANEGSMREVSRNGADYDIGDAQVSMIEQMVQDRRTWTDGR